MSDYFTRLAERALEVGPRPRPVVPSRFERAAAPEPPEIEIEEAAPAPGASSLRPATPAWSAAPLDADPAGRPRPAHQAPSSDRPLVEPPTQPPRPAAQPRLPAPGDTSVTPDGPPPAGERGRRRPEARSGLEGATLEPTPPPTLVPARSGPPASAAPPTGERPAVPAAATVPTPAPVAPRRDLPREAEPVIHVTIGRVEVRAAPAPPSTARPQPQPADGRRGRSSLEAYLRGGGDGR